MRSLVAHDLRDSPSRSPDSFTQQREGTAQTVECQILNFGVFQGLGILEGDGRIWVVSPSNAFGGYVNTFPKGKLDWGLGLRANALKEGFEESGLRVALTGFLCDSHRTTSVTRYYLAKRVGGHPANMGWETQALSLVPRARLAEFVSHKNDQVILQALQQALG
ncbi:NUDIX hydrolase [Acidovorax sp. KKS102]|uniref:NUDIX hydrolase n=1 Tax=Acidovorax sp. KKS102 TaxID=358220 RepID=UPI001EE660E9|nr:NUDIX hydrolase [Acidovorax sp. KKS102]